MKNKSAAYSTMIICYVICCGLQAYSIYLNLDSMHLMAESLAINVPTSHAQDVKSRLDTISSHSHFIMFQLGGIGFLAATCGYFAYMIGKAKGMSRSV